MPFVEWRGESVRVKWWAGEYLPSGKKKYESASGPAPGVRFVDEEEAYNYGLDREHDVRHGAYIPTSTSPLMKPYMWEWWKAQELRPASMSTYKSMIRAQLEPYWGSRRVDQITTIEYDAWHRLLNRKKTAGELSASYVSDLLGLFKMLMDDAVLRYKYRKESPVPPPQPRRGRYEKKQRAEKDPLEMGTVYQLAVNAYLVWGYTGWVYIWHKAFTGMRPGEMYGLRREFTYPAWPAADPDKDRRKKAVARYAGSEPMPAVRVQHQLQWVDGEKSLQPPKYDSWRTLVLPPFLAEMHEALAASHDSKWTFPSMMGGDLLGARFDRDYWAPIHNGSPARSARSDGLRPALPAVEAMEDQVIYRLRHGHKEWLDEHGILRIPSEARMGHEVAGVEGLYGNVTPVMERGIMEALQDRWERFVGHAGGLWIPPFPNRLPNGAS